MVTLILNGRPLPASLQADIRYVLEVHATGYDPVFTRWSVLAGATVVDSGTGNVIFNPHGNQLYAIDVAATNSAGQEEETVFSVDSIPLSGAAEVRIHWTSLTFRSGDALDAEIRVYDPLTLPVASLAWVLYRNNLQIATGSSGDVHYQTSAPGVYRIKVVAVDGRGNSVTGDSAVYVGGGFEIQASPTPPAVNPSCIYLGALYVNEILGAGGPVTSLPYALACYTESVYLLPGTTHISFDLDPLQHQVDDEVVVRTQTGNYTIRGYPSGLSTEQVGYDYTGGLPMLSAPADGVLRMTVEAFNVHDPVTQPFSFRVRVKCWRLGSPIYQYVKCPFSTFPGGHGKRYRHFAALFTEIEAATDVATDLNRLGSAATNVYTTPDVTDVPLATLSTDGAPNPVQTPTGMFLTASNWFAVYEPGDATLPELDAKSVAGQDRLRPFYFTLEQPATPPIIQRIKRLGGNLVVYMSQGSILAGSTVHVRILTSKIVNGSAETKYSIVVGETVYNDAEDTFQRIGSIPINLLDFEFSVNGVVVFFDVDESTATVPPLPCDPPDPVVADAYAYSEIKAPSIVFDGACYTNPTVQPTITGENAADAGAITGCHELICGPVGIYCYTDVSTGSLSADFRQPLYFPAPFVAYGSNPLYCYNKPVLVAEATGTNYEPTRSQQTDALCGDGWIYGECSGTAQIVTVYPYSTVPHDVVIYGSECWSRTSIVPIAGSTAVTLLASGSIFVSAGSVTPVPDCVDASCNGTVVDGTSVVYTDSQTQQKFAVSFENLGATVPFIGAAPQVLDSGLSNFPLGQTNLSFTTRARMFLFNSGATCRENIVTDLTDIAKRIVIIRGGQVIKFEIGIGVGARFVDLQAGDAVYLDIGNQAGLLSGRTRNRRAQVSWNPVIVLPRQYFTAVVSSSGQSVVTALGFTGITNRSSYTLFSTLPSDAEQDLPNPDNIVTVQGVGSGEYTLVRTRATGDPAPPTPGQAPWYAGQSLTGPLTFRFYTSREDQGVNGEMDVWLSNQGSTFPHYLQVDRFRTLVLKDGPIRVATTPGDISRNSLRVASSGSDAHWPYRYVASDGQRITAFQQAGTVTSDGKTFVQVGADPGISSIIVNASPSS